MAKLQKVTADEKKWRAESDAYALVNVQEIIDDKGRYKAALKQVDNIKKDAEKRLSAAGKVTKKKA